MKNPAGGLKHPCASTCSGYRQAREETLRELIGLLESLEPSQTVAIVSGRRGGKTTAARRERLLPGFRLAVEMLQSPEFHESCENGPDPADWLKSQEDKL